MGEKKKIEKTMNKEEFLSFIKNLVSQLEQGYVEILDKKVELPEKFEIEFKYEKEEQENKLELELKW